MYHLLRKLLFLLPPETAAHMTLSMIQAAARNPLTKKWLPDPIAKPVTVWGMTFNNPVGIAAGLDKNGDYIPSLNALGVGFVELGTVTPRPQMGNPKPRLHRLPDVSAIINRMGFNNKGVDYLCQRLHQHRFNGIVGISIGKNADTPEEEAVTDYLTCLASVYPQADYVTVNISSPNTPGLRDLQFQDQLQNLLTQLKTRQQALAKEHQRTVPLLVKVAPDLTEADIEQIAAILVGCKCEGLIATNTALARHNIETHPKAELKGGLSGAPLTQQALWVQQQFVKHLPTGFPIIASGGIMSADDAKARIDHGAVLVQVYSGLVYQGPSLIQNIVNAI